MKLQSTNVKMYITALWKTMTWKEMKYICQWMDQIYLYSHLVLNIYIGKKERRKGRELLKPLTNNSTDTVTTTKLAKMPPLEDWIAYLCILNRKIMYIIAFTREMIYIYLSLPKSFIYLSYCRGHITSIYLNTGSKTFHGKTWLLIKLYCPY